MYTHLNFEWALNVSTLTIKLFNSAAKLFQAAITTATL